MEKIKKIVNDVEVQEFVVTINIRIIVELA